MNINATLLGQTLAFVIFAVLAIFGHRHGCCLGTDVAWYDDAQPDACGDAV